MPRPRFLALLALLLACSCLLQAADGAWWPFSSSKPTHVQHPKPTGERSSTQLPSESQPLAAEAAKSTAATAASVPAASGAAAAAAAATTSQHATSASSASKVASFIHEALVGPVVLPNQTLSDGGGAAQASQEHQCTINYPRKRNRALRVRYRGQTPAQWASEFLIHNDTDLYQSPGGVTINRAMLNMWMQRVSRTFNFRTNTTSLRCLEWDIRYMPYFKCRDKYTFKYEADPNKWEFDYNSKRIRGDAHTFKGLVSDGFFDLIISTQVFEHLAEPHLAMSEIVRILKPGGHLVWTAPHIFRFHAYPFDFQRFTVPGAYNLINSAGLEVLEVLGLGDRVTAAAELFDIRAQSVPHSWLLRTSADFYLNVVAVARKTDLMAILRQDPDELPEPLLEMILDHDPKLKARAKALRGRRHHPNLHMGGELSEGLGRLGRKRGAAVSAADAAESAVLGREGSGDAEEEDEWAPKKRVGGQKGRQHADWNLDKERLQASLRDDSMLVHSFLKGGEFVEEVADIDV